MINLTEFVRRKQGSTNDFEFSNRAVSTPIPKRKQTKWLTNKNTLKRGWSSIQQKIFFVCNIFRDKFQLNARLLMSQSRTMLIFYLFIMIWFLSFLKSFFFGMHSTRGGILGPFIDNSFRAYLRYEKRVKWRSESPHISSDTQLFLEKRRKWKKQSEIIQSGSVNTIIPEFILQAMQDKDIFSMNDNWDHFYDHIIYTDYQMREQLRDEILTHKKLHILYRQLPSWEDKVALWTVCALYWHGGIFLSSQIHSFQLIHSFQHVLSNHTDEYCNSLCDQHPIAFALSSNNDNQEQPISLDILAASPRHPSLLQVIQHLPSHTQLDSFKTYISNQLSSIFSNDQSTNWSFLREWCNECEQGSNLEICCDIFTNSATLFSIRKKTSIYDHDDINRHGHSFLPVMVSVHENQNSQITQTSTDLHPKKPLQEYLIQSKCEPNFLCNRCLRYGKRGSLPKCSYFCNKCYQDIICTAPVKHTNHINIRIEKVKYPTNININHNHTKLIPRIIHQTWLEDLSEERYPDLIRLQNSWKASGWDYRFYDDQSARQFIDHHFPSQFGRAYDSLIPGAFKADFFRYLVLLIHGGVYADIDILLDTNLDSFITPNMAFFTPRDILCEEMDEEFCLWNGLIGAVPGHPFVVRAAERSLNFILERADLFDMERETCRSSGPDMEWWKVRRAANLFLTGPCALGVSMNEVLKNDPLTKINLGWLRTNVKYDNDKGFVNGKPGGGDTLICTTIKNNLGAMRFYDEERNIIIASTEISGVSKSPLQLRSDLDLYTEQERANLTRKGCTPYSTIGGQWTWGSKMLYIDNMVTNESVSLDIRWSNKK